MTANGCLNRNLEELPRNLIFQLFTHLLSALVSRIRMNDKGQRINLLLVHQNVQLHHFSFLIAFQRIVKACVTFTPGL